MSNSPQDGGMPTMRYLEAQRPMVEVETLLEPSPHVPAPSEEQARVVDQLFATEPSERNAMLDAINLAAVGMLLHDVVADTLAPPTNEEDEMVPLQIKPKKNTESEPA